MGDRMFREWRKSSRSIGGNDNCVEVAVAADGNSIGVRDSKDHAGAVLVFAAPVWARFVGAPPIPAPR